LKLYADSGVGFTFDPTPGLLSCKVAMSVKLQPCNSLLNMLIESVSEEDPQDLSLEG
jgi:hypothetical protein